MDKKNLLTKSTFIVLGVIILDLTSVWNNMSPTEPKEKNAG